ncbi:hypothetical protein B0H13DRAFT_2316851 [Mycena leptocephala]|nr:hypothetical protein B0H13DRAFT_2316851 [Mycena leptocephala]
MKFRFTTKVFMVLLVSFGVYLFHYAMTTSLVLLKLGFEDPNTHRESLPGSAQTANHLSHLYTLLPPTSYHMTVFEGVLGKECTALFEQKMSSFDLQCDPPYHISITGFGPLQIGIEVHLEPSTAEENARIRAYEIAWAASAYPLGAP